MTITYHIANICVTHSQSDAQASENPKADVIVFSDIVVSCGQNSLAQPFRLGPMTNNLASFITGSQLIDVFERPDWVIERARTRTICRKMLYNRIINTYRDLPPDVLSHRLYAISGKIVTRTFVTGEEMIKACITYNLALEASVVSVKVKVHNLIAVI